MSLGDHVGVLGGLGVDLEGLWGGEGAADCAERLNPPPPEGSERV